MMEQNNEIQIKSYVEHVAILTEDLEWHVNFFKNALGMKVKETQIQNNGLRQIWLGGIQLTEVKKLSNKDKNQMVWHIGIMTDNIEQALENVYTYDGITQMEQGRNWFMLPSGLAVELCQAIKADADTKEVV